MPKSIVDEERRTARRFHVGWNVVVKGTDQRGEGFDEPAMLENLSSSGAFLYISRTIQPGSKLELKINLPFQKKSNWMQYSARVLRIKKANGNNGIAVKFDTVRPLFVEG